MLPTSLKAKSFGSLLLRFSRAPLTAITTVMLARILGLRELGIYEFCLATSALFFLPAQTGISVFTVRYTSVYMASGHWSYLKGVWCWTSRIILLYVGLALSFSYALSKTFLISNIESFDIVTFGVSLIVFSLMLLSEFQQAKLRGLNFIILGQISESCVKPILFLCLLFTFSTLGIDLNSAFVAILHAISALVSFSISTVILKRKEPTNLGPALKAFNSHSWVRSLLPFSMIGSAQVLYKKTDILMLGTFGNPTQVAIYRVALQGASLVDIGLQAINKSIGPKVARLYEKALLQELQLLVTKSARWSGAFALFMTLLISIFGYSLISRLFGNDYVSAYTPLIILAVGQLINSLSGSVGLILNMTGHENLVLLGLITSVLCNITLNLLLIPHFNILGASIATMLTYCIWNMLLIILCKKETGIKSFAFL